MISSNKFNRLFTSIVVLILMFVVVVLMSSCTTHATKAEIEELQITLHVRQADYQNLILLKETRRECEKEYYEFIGSRYANDPEYNETKVELLYQMENSQRQYAAALLNVSSSAEVNCARVRNSILKHDDHHFRMLWTENILSAKINLY